MSDPLSIAASVTGLVTFGLKTCTAVTSYLDAFNSRNQEVEAAKQQARGIYDLLATVETSIAKISSTHRSSTSAVRACIVACEQEILALERLVSELQGSTSVSHNNRIVLSMKEQGQKLTYAFHRSRLEKVQAQLAKVTGTLQTALQAAGLDVAVSIETTIMTMQRSTLPNIQNQLDSIGPQIAAHYSQVTDQVQEYHRLIRDDVSLLKSIASGQNKQLELLTCQQAVGRLIAKPSQLSELCQIIDDQTVNTISTNVVRPNSISQSNTHLGGKQSGHLELFKPLHVSCLCRERRFTTQKIVTIAFWVFCSESSRTENHLPDCPLRSGISSAKEMRWEMRYTGLREFVNCAIGLSFSTSFGAGGFSLSPNFTYYPSVNSSTAPVSRIFDLLHWFLDLFPDSFFRETETWTTTFLEFADLCIADIILLYRDGKAAPKAIDELGRSAMHHLSRSQKGFRAINTPVHRPLKHRVDSQLLNLSNTLIRWGVPSMTQDIHGVTPAWDLCIYRCPRKDLPAAQLHQIWPNSPAIIDLICSRDPYTPILAQSSLGGGHVEPMLLLSLLRDSQAAAEACECGPLSLAVLSGDKEKVASLLATNPSTLKERSLFGHTPLHLAAAHQACLKLLIRSPGIALIDQTDSIGHTALEYAAFVCSSLHTVPCNASVALILESGCRVSNQFSIYFSDLCQNCRGELLKHIKNRRERLKMYALERLPGLEAAALGLRQAAVLDSKANLVIQALKNRGFEVPSPLQLDVPDAKFDSYQPESMFHQSPLNCLAHSYFDTLYQLGFRDFGQSASLHMRPLHSWLKFPHYIGISKLHIWNSQRYEACAWLIEHGANLWDPIPGDTCASTAHHLYGSINLMEVSNTGAYPEYVVPRVQFLTKILATHDVRDNCHCECSPGGCSPFIWFLRANTSSEEIFLKLPDDRKRIIYGFPKFLNGWKPVITMEQIRSAIRYLTFELLGICHTCSHDGNFQVIHRDENEIHELMSEDNSLLQLLQDLVEEFESEFQSLRTEDDPYGIPFWEIYWPQRMEEVVTELNDVTLSEDEFLSAQSLGVAWHQKEDHPIYQWTERANRKSDWSIDVDDTDMWYTFKSVKDWTSRLELIMSRAYSK